ncbi:galactose oxidase/kelch repeat protein [Citrus sinensis]|uniref:Galactose oxidase/kelch repeat protein n=1 Tax=Citrus sinensis TaxID=2711 RepID=A0ACB8JF93_CITSI|nr:galactose oxidase/kelch repeat protein [Citrus sinensis]KAH9716211.1 galactose oxidase/kelch repeat protein [Citrus sinensis]
MGRSFVGKNSTTPSPARVVLSIFVMILGFALVADFFWASSSKFTSSYLNIASNWSPYHNSIILPNNGPQKGENIGVKTKKDVVPKRILPATFQDLPAPELKWEKMKAAPVPRLDGAAIQIKNLLYVFAGYGSIDYVHSHVDIYNFTDNTWGGRFDMPREMAHSHLGMVTDGRYIYVVTGQYGPQCRGPTAHTFVLDTETKKWQDLPPLPVPRRSLEPCSQGWKTIRKGVEN